MDQLYKLFHNQLFFNAAYEGCIDSISKIYNYYQHNRNIQVEMLQHQQYFAFGIATTFGYLDVARLIHSWSSQDERVAMIAADEYGTFRHASADGHLPILKALYDWSSHEEG